jgi:hypothetical protein
METFAILSISSTVANHTTSQPTLPTTEEIFENDTQHSPIHRLTCPIMGALIEAVSRARTIANYKYLSLVLLVAPRHAQNRNHCRRKGFVFICSKQQAARLKKVVEREKSQILDIVASPYVSRILIFL